MSKSTKNIICENCDSEYNLKFTKTMVSGNPSFCPFCGEAHEAEQIEEVEPDEQDHDSDEDENY